VVGSGTHHTVDCGRRVDVGHGGGRSGGGSGGGRRHDGGVVFTAVTVSPRHHRRLCERV